MTYTFLSFPLSPAAPLPPAIPPIQLEPFLTIAKDGANVTQVKLMTHTGTHVDAPSHVVENSSTLTDFSASELVFERPYLIDLPLPDCTVVQPIHLEPFVECGQAADLLLFRFGYGPVRRQAPSRYSMQSPGFGVESARFLMENFPRMRAVGMDVPSLSCIADLERTFAAHTELLGGAGKKFLVIEDMNLEQDLTRLQTVVVAPLWIEKIDGGPATIFGWLA